LLTFHFNLSPNPMKVALLLEELGLPYEAVPVDTRRGGQFEPGYLALNPNGKVPAIVDDGEGGPVTVFDSNAILLYLAEKSGRFLPPASERGEFLSWLMFVATGLGPFFGQAVHFRHFAPEPVAYARTRYEFEARRHLAVLEGRLEGRDWLVGDAYSVVDMAAWGWGRAVPFVLGGDEAWADFPELKRLVDTISARPAAARVEALRAKHAGAFAPTLDEEGRRHMFKHLAA
jgi:GSH-dependent disulfide-bond oxidoreductase